MRRSTNGAGLGRVGCGTPASCRLVARTKAKIVGWAALSAVSRRAIYAGVAEVSVYVAASARGRGVGRALLAELVRESERQGIWTLQAGIFPENVASIELHKRLGLPDSGDQRADWLHERLVARRMPDGAPQRLMPSVHAWIRTAKPRTLGMNP